MQQADSFGTKQQFTDKAHATSKKGMNKLGISQQFKQQFKMYSESLLFSVQNGSLQTAVVANRVNLQNIVDISDRNNANATEVSSWKRR